MVSIQLTLGGFLLKIPLEKLSNHLLQNETAVNTKNTPQTLNTTRSVHDLVQ